MTQAPLLEIKDLHVHYGAIHALKGISLTLRAGEVVALIGSNGAGKSTLLRTISGLVDPTEGHVLLDGAALPKAKPQLLIKGGVVHVPEGRGIFGPMTVKENLLLGAHLRHDHHEIKLDLKKMYDRFPILRERRKQAAGTLSGGEQQMLAIARGLMARPRALLLDEPSLGLAPLLVRKIFDILTEINQNGCAILVVEQNAQIALKTAHRGYVLETGKIVLENTASSLLHDEAVRKAYLGE
jgi:branched-chain amino acid transport system ATP-binding protein